MSSNTMKQYRVPATLSLVTMIASAIIALVSIPFILIAGLGLLLAIPFGTLAAAERRVHQSILAGEKVSVRTRRKRLALIGCSVLGSSIVILLIQLANKTNNELSTDRKIQALIPWVVVLVVFTLLSISVQLLYKKK